MAGKGDLQSYANPRGQTMTTPHSDTCPRCGLPFFTIHSKMDCILALRARVAQLEGQLNLERELAIVFNKTILIPLLSPPPPDVLESLEIAHKRGGFD